MNEHFRLDTVNEGVEESSVGFVSVPGFVAKPLAEHAPDRLATTIAQAYPDSLVLQPQRDSLILKDDPGSYAAISDHVLEVLESIKPRVDTLILSGNSFGANFAVEAHGSSADRLLLISPVTNIPDTMAWVNDQDEGFIQFPGSARITMAPQVITDSKAFVDRIADTIGQTPTALIDLAGDPLVNQIVHEGLATRNNIDRTVTDLGPLAHGYRRELEPTVVSHLGKLISQS